MRVAIIGRTRMLYDTINCLLNAGHEIVIIGTCKAVPEYDITEKEFEEKANELGVPFFCDTNINSPQIVELLTKANADIAVSVNWLTMIKEKVINIFRYGILNAHCGDLPRYRGNACPNWAIIKGEMKFAISIHFMLEDLDAGDVLVKKFYPITENTTITDIYRVTEDEIPRLFCEAMNKIQQGYMGVPQSRNPKDALRCYPRIPTDSIIDWNMSCDEIVKVVRASAAPFEGAYTFYGNMKIYIMHCIKKDFECPCHVYTGQVVAVNKIDGTVGVAAGDGVIEFEKVKIDGVEHNAADMLKSTRIRLNYCLQEEIYYLRNRIEKLEKQIKLIM